MKTCDARSSALRCCLARRVSLSLVAAEPLSTRPPSCTASSPRSIPAVVTIASSQRSASPARSTRRARKITLARQAGEARGPEGHDATRRPSSASTTCGSRSTRIERRKRARATLSAWRAPRRSRSSASRASRSASGRRSSTATSTLDDPARRDRDDPGRVGQRQERHAQDAHRPLRRRRRLDPLRRPRTSRR